MRPQLAQSRVRDALPLALVLGLAAELALSLMIGAYPVPPLTVLRLLAHLALPLPLPAHPAWSETEQVVVQSVRLPRVLVASVAGGGLGLAGAALQGLFRNPLVGPDIIGVSGGAACGGVLAILLGLSGGLVVALAFAGGLLAITLAAGLARAMRTGGALTVVLAGVVVGGFFAALLTLAEYVADPQSMLPAIVYWLLGSFADADRTKALTIGLATLVGGGLIVALRWRINLLSLGDTDAAALGLQPNRLRWVILALVALIVAAQVAVSGIVGWAGLIVPHMARFVVGPDHRRLLPASGLVGAGFMLGVDDLARSVPSQELPIGLVTALIGTPAFALLLWRTHRLGWRD